MVKYETVAEVPDPVINTRSGSRQDRRMLEKEFIEKCRNGNEAALERLYNHLSSKMKGVCLRYALSDFDAEDIFQ